MIRQVMLNNNTLFVNNRPCCFTPPRINYDVYTLRLSKTDQNAVYIAGVKLDDVQLDTANVITMVLTDVYGPESYATAEEIDKAVTWQSYDTGYQMRWGVAQLNLNFTAAELPNIVQMHTAPIYSGLEGIGFTLTMIGIKDGVATVLGSQQCVNHPDTVYTVNID